jgi:hypothetical protein
MDVGRRNLFGYFCSVIAPRCLVGISKAKVMEKSRSGGFGMFGVTMLLCLPAMLSVFVSAQISGNSYHSSALWFMYQVSQYIGVLGIIVATALTIIKAGEGVISRVAVMLMGFSVLLSVFLLWYAVHIYRSPWF